MFSSCNKMNYGDNHNINHHFTILFDALTINLTSFLIVYESIDIKDVKAADNMLKKCEKMYESIAHVRSIICNHPSEVEEEDEQNLKILDDYVDRLNVVSMQCITQDRDVVYKPLVKAWLIKPTDTRINVIYVPNLPSDEYAKILGFKSEDDITLKAQHCFNIESSPSSIYLVLNGPDDAYNKVATELLDKVKNQNLYNECKGTFLIIKQKHNAQNFEGSTTMHPSSRFEDMDLDVKTFVQEYGNYALRKFMKEMNEDFSKMKKLKQHGEKLHAKTKLSIPKKN